MVFFYDLLYNMYWLVKMKEERIVPIWLGILIGVVALAAGVALGFFVARRTMMKYLKENPPINEQMIRMMMMQMGMTPSQKKVNQMMKAMNGQMK